MSFIVRDYSSKDYPTAVKWWQARAWPPVPEIALPATGVIVEDYCVGFIYKSDSAISWVEWIVSNPDTDKNERDTAMNLLIDNLITKAKSMGAQIVFTSTSAANEHLVKRFHDNGFKTTDINVTHLMRIV
jgi:hypothetical protein